MTAINYTLAHDGIHKPSTSVQHRESEYAEHGFNTLSTMQKRHFWYLGRHRFLLAALRRFQPTSVQPWTAVDLGGGVGGWVRYLCDHRPTLFRPLALADSSLVALRMAGLILPEGVQRFHVDLMDLGWTDYWDVVFLLDVIEHLPDDLQALREARQAMKPGGLLFVTTPALPQFWSYNDDLANHLRRYTRRDFARLAASAGLQLCDSRYFMFLLSPLYWLIRRRPMIDTMTADQQRDLMIRAHRIPARPINAALSAIFAAETPIGHLISFPWGTSILGIFRKP
jgi:SAM-dependent methyltransferase